MSKNLFLTAFLLLLCTFLSAQREQNITDVDLFAGFDGHYQHQVWQIVPELEAFVTYFPNPGQKPLQDTRVKIAYNRFGIYVLAHCQSAKLRDDGSARDQRGGDYISVRLDTWQDRQNNFDFTVTAAGQMYDSRSSNTGFDTWWQAKTRKVDDGWVAEIFIPFTALRFPDKGRQQWGFQVIRYDRSTGETSTWNPQNPYIQDDAWQYGILTGLGDLKQKFRFSMALLSNMSNQKGDFNELSLAALGVDGRVGLGSATTLDVALLPNIIILSPALDGGGSLLISNPSYPAPRQYAADEANVYRKTQIFTPDFNMGASWFDTNTPLLPGEFLTNTREPQKRLSGTLSSRMRGGVGLVASHVRYEKPETFYASQSPFPSSVRLVQLGRPSHTNLSVEKLLRNNSWVNLSHNLFVVGQDFVKNQSGLSVQLRDKSNQYQVALQAHTAFDNQNQFANLSVGKVNGPWTWQLDYSYAEFAARGRFFSRSSGKNESVSLKAAKTNFHPRYKGWLRTDHSASLRRANGNTNTTLGLTGGLFTQNLDDRLFVQYSYAVLNQKFESFSAGLSFVPTYAPREVNILNGKFRAGRYLPLSIGIGYTTDERKRWQISTYASANLRLADVQKSYTLQISPSYVPNKFWRMSLYNRLVLQPTRLVNAPQIPVPNAVTRVQRLNLIQQYNIELFASRKVYFAFSQFVDLNRFFFKAYRFNEDIDLVPYDYTYELNPARESDIQSTLRAYWFFTPNSQLRFSYNRSWDTQTNIGSNGLPLFLGFPANEVIGNAFKVFNVELIWNLNRH